jgi:hypothetical protein
MSSESNTGGRPKGSVNKAGHLAGGVRAGAGRKRVRPVEDSVPQATAAESSSSRMRLPSHTSPVSGREV